MIEQKYWITKYFFSNMLAMTPGHTSPRFRFKSGEKTVGAAKNVRKIAAPNQTAAFMIPTNRSKPITGSNARKNLPHCQAWSAKTERGRPRPKQSALWPRGHEGSAALNKRKVSH